MKSILIRFLFSLSLSLSLSFSFVVPTAFTQDYAGNVVNIRPGADKFGWSKVTEAWTYASATTINVPTGATSRYQVGDKLRFNNTSTKYFSVIAVASTLLTVTAGNDYSVANSAISAISVSRAASPFGFPYYFSWTPTITAASPMTISSPGAYNCYFNLTGRTVNFWGTFNATTATTASAVVYFTIPVTLNSTVHSGNPVLGSAYLFNGFNDIGCSLSEQGATTLRIMRYDGGNHNLNPNTFRVQGSFIIQ